MSISCTIRHPDNGSLGTDKEVMLRLLEAFPGTAFQYEVEKPPGLVAFRLSLLMRVWTYFFHRTEIQYPRHRGYFERADGGAVEFQFAVGDSVRIMTATSYGRTGGLDSNFARLSKATGWTVAYPRF